MNANPDDLLTLANKIEEAANNPEQAAKLVEKRLRLEKKSGVIATIISFVKSYKEKAPGVSNAAWLEAEMAKNTDYAQGKSAAEIKEAAEGICGSIRDYEQAKQDLVRHKADGGTRESWLHKKLEEGAEANGYADAAQYAEEVAQGMDEANKEIYELRFADGGGKEEAKQ
jgi:hypothetical protein